MEFLFRKGWTELLKLIISTVVIFNLNKYLENLKINNKPYYCDHWACTADAKNFQSHFTLVVVRRVNEVGFHLPPDSIVLIR
jgi:hypothetical protein